jgi:hypothetical protein
MRVAVEQRVAEGGSRARYRARLRVRLPRDCALGFARTRARLAGDGRRTE